MLGGSDNTGSDHGLFPSLGDVHIVDTVLGALVDVAGHLAVNVLGSNVDLHRAKLEGLGDLPERRSC